MIFKHPDHYHGFRVQMDPYNGVGTLGVCDFVVEESLNSSEAVRNYSELKRRTDESVRWARGTVLALLRSVRHASNHEL
jgi:hypothetical protein